MFAEYLKAIESIYAAHAAESKFSFELDPPADARALDAVERELGTPLDPQLRQLWLTTHSSHGAPLFEDGRFLNAYALLSTTEALDERACLQQRRESRARRAHLSPKEPPVRAGRMIAHVPTGPPRYEADPRVGVGWYSPGWLPFALEETGVGLIVDHAPLGTGYPGQVLRYAPGEEEILFVASSIADLLPASRRQIELDPLEFLSIF